MSMTPFLDLKTVSILIASVAGLYLFVALVWSIIHPDRRVWPPKEATTGLKVRVWAATIAIFAAGFGVGLIDWNELGWPAGLRWGVGLSLIILGNIVVWSGVMSIGFDATSGEVDTLKTDGLYAHSRNPQYIADMAIILGWAVLSASSLAFVLALGGILVLGLAPFAEEPWLEENYGQQYREYKSRVRRFF